MTRFTRISSFAVAFALGGVVLAGSASAYNVTVDQLTIYKNGNLYINDEFNDGNAPPASGSNFGTGTTPATYFAAGTWTEANGRARMDSANGLQVIQSGYSSNLINRHDARLNSGNGADTAIGLRDNDSFYAMALFDLSSVLDKNGSSYNLRFRDSGSGNPINDEARIGVRRTNNGDLSIRFGDYDLDAGTFTVLDNDALQPGFNQIILRLDNDGSGFATGSYAYVNGGIDLADAGAIGALGFTQMTGSAELFSDNDWTRVSLSAFENIEVPEPDLALIFGAAFGALVWKRRRARH